MVAFDVTPETLLEPRERSLVDLSATGPAHPHAKPPKPPVAVWHAPAVIAENNFIYKSLSNWAFNVAVGCSHACRFCYVPSVATIKQAAKLAECPPERHLHLWPDKSLGSQALADRMPNPRQYLKRLEHWWHRVSEWPCASHAD